MPGVCAIADDEDDAETRMSRPIDRSPAACTYCGPPTKTPGPEAPPPQRAPAGTAWPKPAALSQLEDAIAAASSSAGIRARGGKRRRFMIVRLKTDTSAARAARRRDRRRRRGSRCAAREPPAG